MLLIYSYNITTKFKLIHIFKIFSAILTQIVFCENTKTSTNKSVLNVIGADDQGNFVVLHAWEECVNLLLEKSTLETVSKN